MEKIINRIKSYLLRLLFADELKTCRDMIEVASRSDTYDVNPYLHGMANGMIYLYSIWTERDPMYLDAPDKWLDEKYNRLDTALISDQAKISHHEHTITLLRERINQLESEAEERREKIEYLREDNTKLDQRYAEVFDFSQSLALKLDERRQRIKAFRVEIKQLKFELATAKERVKGCERVCHECHFKKEDPAKEENASWWWKVNLVYVDEPGAECVLLDNANLYHGTTRKACIQQSSSNTFYALYFDGAHAQSIKHEDGKDLSWRTFDIARQYVENFIILPPNPHFNSLSRLPGPQKKNNGWIRSKEDPTVTQIRSRLYVDGECKAGIFEIAGSPGQYFCHTTDISDGSPRILKNESRNVKYWTSIETAEIEVAEIVNRKAEEDNKDEYNWEDFTGYNNPVLVSSVLKKRGKAVAKIAHCNEIDFDAVELIGDEWRLVCYSANKKPITWETLEAAKKAVEKRARNREAKKIVVTPKEERKKEHPKPGLYWIDLLLYNREVDLAGNSESVCVASLILLHGRYTGFWHPEHDEIKRVKNPLKGLVCQWETLETAQRRVEELYREKNKSIFGHWFDYTGPDGEENGSLWKHDGVVVAEIKKVPYKSKYTYIAFWQPEGKPIKYSGEVCRWPVNDLAGAKEWIETEYRVRNSK